MVTRGFEAHKRLTHSHCFLGTLQHISLWGKVNCSLRVFYSAATVPLLCLCLLAADESAALSFAKRQFPLRGSFLSQMFRLKTLNFDVWHFSKSAFPPMAAFQTHAKIKEESHSSVCSHSFILHHLKSHKSILCMIAPIFRIVIKIKVIKCNKNFI